MKKYLSFIVCLAVMISAMTVFPFRGFAEEGGIALPEFDYPTVSYPTFAETGIPYDEIINLFPETLEIKYENGVLYVKDLGGDAAYYTDRLNYDGYEGELVDGYWEFEVSSEAYNSGGNISMYTDSHSWHAGYDVSGKRGVVSVTTYIESYSRIVVLYPTEGYGEQYVQVIYDLLSGIRVSDTYQAGSLKEQTVEIQNGNQAFWARYDSKGNIEYVNVSVYSTGEDATFIPGMGWSEHSWEYVPTDAPTGYEHATLESLLAMGPTDIGCEHQWSEPLCDVPSICALCKREKGEPIGHSWVSGSEYDTCSTCNGILYRIPDIDIPSFEGRPYLDLDKAGIDVDAITSKLLQKISTKYENGIFMIPNIDGYYFDARLPSEGFVDHKTVNGWNMMEVAEEDLEQLKIAFSKSKERGDHVTWYDFCYDSDGCLVSLNLYDSESEKSISMVCKENTVKLSYPKEKDGNIEYTDVYENGDLTSQIVCDLLEPIWVYYDSDLNVKKVELIIKGEYVSLIPGKGWTSDEMDGQTIPVPEGFEDKDAAYFAANYPHNIDFCIHSFETSDDGSVKKCVKCGETVELKKETDSDIVVIVLVSVGVVLAVAAAAGVIVAVKKKKSQKAD